jgi:hypothetical protein
MINDNDNDNGDDNDNELYYFKDGAMVVVKMGL